MDGFLFLTKHYSGLTSVDDNDWYGEQRKYLDKSVTNMKFHLVKVPPTQMEEGTAERWSEGGKYTVETEKVLFTLTLTLTLTPFIIISTGITARSYHSRSNRTTGKETRHLGYPKNKGQMVLFYGCRLKPNRVSREVLPLL